MKALHHDRIHLTWPRRAMEGGLRSWPLLQSHDLKTIRPSSVYRLKLLAPSISAIGWGEFYVVLHLYSLLILRGMSYQRITYSTPAWWDHKCWGYLQEHECGWLSEPRISSRNAAWKQWQSTRDLIFLPSYMPPPSFKTIILNVGCTLELPRESKRDLEFDLIL